MYTRWDLDKEESPQSNKNFFLAKIFQFLIVAFQLTHFLQILCQLHKTAQFIGTPHACFQLPEEEVYFTQKEHTIVVEPEESQKISPYFVPEGSTAARGMF